jgi:uncharacterized membrane protein
LILAVTVVVAAAPPAVAKPEFLDTLVAKYHIKDDSPLGDKSCGICHVSEEDYHFNPYGKEVANYLTDHNLTAVDEAVLAAVGKMHTNGNAMTNDEALAAGKAPADLPAGNVAQGSAGTAAPSAPAAPKAKPLVPKNFFHPAIVHFPIALLIAGVLLDLIGYLKKKPALLLAGWYNLVLAAVTSLGAICSGVIAMALMKLPYKGLIFNHLKLAILAAVMMWIMFALRVHRHENMKTGARVVYYVLASVALVAIAVAGHLGGSFVYGD